MIVQVKSDGRMSANIIIVSVFVCLILRYRESYATPNLRPTYDDVEAYTVSKTVSDGECIKIDQ